MSAGVSYLNSSVSLISKASIRYEGTLFQISPQEATITLSNVRSYGTEDRKVEKYLAPKDTLFEYIIFKANDIKELIVDEPLDDPAIVTAQMPSSSNNNTYSGFSNDNQNSQGNALSSEAQATLNGITGNNQANNAPSVSSAGQTGNCFRSRGSTPSSELSSNTNKQKNEKTRSLNNANHLNHQSSNRNNQNNNQRKNWDNNRMNNYHYNNQRNNRNYNGNYNNTNRRPGNYQHNYQNHFNRNQGGFRHNDDRMPNHLNNRNGYRGNNSLNNRNGTMMVKNGRCMPINKNFKPTLKTEFDFEKANQVFKQMVDKLEDLNISVNGEKSEKSGSEDKDDSKTDIEKSDKVDDDGNFYDMTKSFFDNISCEAIERTKGNQKKFDWKQERKINAETFGLKLNYRRNDGFRRPFVNQRNNNGNQNRRFNNGNSQPRNAPKTNSS